MARPTGKTTWLSKLTGDAAEPEPLRVTVTLKGPLAAQFRAVLGHVTVTAPELATALIEHTLAHSGDVRKLLRAARPSSTTGSADGRPTGSSRA